MSKQLALSNLKPGAIARVIGFEGETHLTSRLVELGIIPGISVRLIKTAPLGGPVEVKVREYYISIRLLDAGHILVEELQ